MAMKTREPSITKITRPAADGILPRKRLFQSMDRSRSFPVTWVTGPAGSGKTALLASYLDARKLPCLWYQIDERDGDIASFFYYMGLAVKKTLSGSKKPMPLLTPEYSGGVPAFTRAYFEDLCGRLIPPLGDRGKIRSAGSTAVRKEQAGFVIVFDDYQNVAANSGFHEMIVHGLDVIPGESMFSS